MMGAAAATLVAYVAMFLGMTVRAQQVFPVAYQWRRIALVVGAAVGLTVLGKALHVPLAGAVLLIAVYPLILLPLGFYLPVELRRLRARLGRPLAAVAPPPPRARAPPRPSGPRRRRCRRGCARRSTRRRARTSARSDPAGHARSAGTRATRPPPSSQPKRSRPGIPVSAATVTGVLWDAAALGSRPLRWVSSA